MHDSFLSLVYFSLFCLANHPRLIYVTLTTDRIKEEGGAAILSGLNAGVTKSE